MPSSIGKDKIILQKLFLNDETWSVFYIIEAGNYMLKNLLNF